MVSQCMLNNGKWKYDNNLNTNFHSEKVPKGNASYKYLSLICARFYCQSKENVLFSKAFRRMQI